MNNTAVSARLREAQDEKAVHMIFESREHEALYYEKLERAGRKDCYHKALFYIHISNLFACGYAVYFGQGIKLRHPEYCCKQNSMDEIMMEMEEGWLIKAEVYGDGVDIWLRGQGDLIEVID